MTATATSTLAGIPRPSREPQVQTVDVTPELAAKWLERNTKNRNVRQTRVELYARDMAAGRWQFTGDPIRFDAHGVLLDGQHRCHAIVKSGATVRTLVIWNLPADAQDAMDIGAARKLGDQLTLAGTKNGSKVAAVLRRLVAYESGRRSLSGGVPSHAEMHAYLEENPDTVTRAVEVAQRARQYRCPSVIGMAYYVCARIDRPAADHFFVTQLIDGIGLAPGDAARALAKRLNDITATRGPTNDDEMLRLIFLAWNAFRDGRSLTKLQAPKGGWNPSNFPEPR